MSLLDDVSIVVTPNGYKAGTLYGVLPVPTVGNELVTDGSNANAGANWNANTNWNKTVAGVFSCDGSSTADINQTNTLAEVGKQYILSFEVLSINAGGVLVIKFGGAVGTDRTAVGVYSEIITATSTDRIRVKADSANTVGSVTGISVKEWTASDMDVTRATAATRVDENGLVNYAEVLGSELVTNGSFTTDSDWYETGTWSIESNYATASANGTSQYIQQDFTITNGKTYLFTYEIIENTLNGVGSALSGSGGFVQIFLSNVIGTHQVYITADDDAAAYALKIGVSATATTGTIKLDNVSVKEADRDNVPRIDYTGGGCPHILAEPQRTNLVTYSEDTSQWTDSGITYSVNYIISPDGTLNGSKAIINNTITSSNTRPMTSVAVTSGTNYVFSVFGKADEFDMINLDFSNSAFSSVSVDFNLTNGTVTFVAGSPVSQGVEDYGNGWYRCYVVATAIATTTTALIIRLDDNPTGDGTKGLYLWGSQFEEGSYPTSYIPTSGSTVTRNKDVFTRDGIASLINSTEGVLFVEMAALSDDGTYRQILFHDNAYVNRIALRYMPTSNQIDVYLNNGTVQAQFSYNLSNALDFNKIAFKYKQNDFALWVNGVEVGTDTSGVTFSANTLQDIDFDFTNNYFFFGKVKQLQVYDTALTDNQLIQLTGEAGTHFFESYSEMAETLTYTIQ
jgi:hypothetical protein